MEIKSFNNLPTYKILFESDQNGREIRLFNLKKAFITSETTQYPNTLLSNGLEVIDPMDEMVMSLKDVNIEKKLDPTKPKNYNIETTPVFYFIYNTDNYYHFIYDTLPYLISYFKLKEEVKDLKLLMAYPNKTMEKFYNFNLEFLELFDVGEGDIIMSDKNTIYEDVYISNSYTHGIDSNLPPRDEVYEFYDKLMSNIMCDSETPKLIYISRRSWVHGDSSNIGTNYTHRRRLINEDEFVTFLEEKGFTEVFTEKLTTKEKLCLFKNAEIVIGAIGGGLCNVLFSNKTTKLIPIISPTFLDVNNRFKYSFNNVDCYNFDNTSHYEKSDIKTNMRVLYNDIIGEVSEVNGGKVKIKYVNEFTAGWSDNVKFNEIVVDVDKVKPIDNGLNSPWVLDIKKFKEFYEKRFDSVSPRVL